MRIERIFAIALLIFCALPGVARADAATLLGRYVGYQIVAVKTVKKWVSQDKNTAKTGFEGCEFGRYIVFDDDTYLRCNGYGYQYAFMPQAVILMKGTSAIMIIDDESYQMSVN